MERVLDQCVAAGVLVGNGRVVAWLGPEIEKLLDFFLAERVLLRLLLAAGAGDLLAADFDLLAGFWLRRCWSRFRDCGRGLGFGLGFRFRHRRQQLIDVGHGGRHVYHELHWHNQVRFRLKKAHDATMEQEHEDQPHMHSGYDLQCSRKLLAHLLLHIERRFNNLYLKRARIEDWQDRESSIKATWYSPGIPAGAASTI